jgi:basic amino acid/polyamine antiporter, APA family
VKQRGGLLRILGVGFGIAVVVGGTIGVGILRTPGEVAALLGNVWLLLGIWVLGGVYVLLGSISVAELGTMLPQAGGFYVYARRAFGDGIGLMVGSSDWLGQCATIAYAGVSAGDFLTALAPGMARAATVIACVMILLFGVLHWTGLRVSSRAQEWTTVLKGIAFTALAAACFWGGRAPVPHSPRPFAGAASAWHLFVPFFVALQAVIVTYDGWYCAIYFSEEDRNPGRNLPRSIIWGTLLVIGAYLLLNVAFLRVLSLPRLAASKLAAADAMALIAGPAAGNMVTWMSLLSLLPLINAVLLCSTRILFAMTRDGLLLPRAAAVNARGTPAVMWACIAAAVLFAATGTFDRLLAIAGFIFVVNHCTAFASLLVLRRREPAATRPFRAWGYPWTTLLALGGGASFLAGALISDPENSFIALGLVLAGYPLYRLALRVAPRRRAEAAGQG